MSLGIEGCGRYAAKRCAAAGVFGDLILQRPFSSRTWKRMAEDGGGRGFVQGGLNWHGCKEELGFVEEVQAISQGFLRLFRPTGAGETSGNVCPRAIQQSAAEEYRADRV